MTQDQLRLKIIDRILRTETIEELKKLDQLSLDAVCREVDQENKKQDLFDKVKYSADFVQWAEQQIGGK